MTKQIMCRDCGFFAVQLKDTQEVVAPCESQRQTGLPPSNSRNGAATDTTPICAVAAKNLIEKAGGTELNGKDFQAVSLDKHQCGSFRQWYPGMSPKEHLAMTIVEQMQKAESRRTTVSLIAVVLAGLVGPILGSWLGYQLAKATDAPSAVAPTAPAEPPTPATHK